eukprot:SAG31_NODE_7958_length_1555_cov_1.227335_2_plen_26_part_01
MGGGGQLMGGGRARQGGMTHRRDPVR